MLNLRTLLAALFVVALAALPPAFAAHGSAAQASALKVPGMAGLRCNSACAVVLARRSTQPAPAAAPAPAPVGHY